MKIVSKIKRQTEDPSTGDVTVGSVIHFGANCEVAYHFKPDASGLHTCDVTDPEHVARLLSITEGFELHPSELSRSEGKPSAGAGAAKAGAKKSAVKAPPAKAPSYDSMTDEQLAKEYAEVAGEDPAEGTTRAQLVESLTALAA